MKPRRTDGNQSKIVRAFKQAGAVVQDVSSYSGLGFDLIVRRGRIWVVEVKNPAMPPSGRKLTESEQAAKALWGDQYRVIETVDDAIAMLGGK